MMSSQQAGAVFGWHCFLCPLEKRQGQNLKYLISIPNSDEAN